MGGTGHDEEESAPLFWSIKLEPNKSHEIDEPAIDGYIVHITNACFGSNVTKQSRTVVMINLIDGSEAPICVLRQGQHENHCLDLLFNESTTITLKGEKPSVVYLTGYIQPPMEALEKMQIQNNERDKAFKEVSKNMNPRKLTAKEQAAMVWEYWFRITMDNKSNICINGITQIMIKYYYTKKYKIMKGGIKYRDMKDGDGEKISNGDKLTVYYVGQLQDKKVFDKSISGTGYQFNFGTGDVIKGWDLGLKGMRIGGKRRVIIPPKYGYGVTGSPPVIPPNATLTFTIEIKGAN